VDVSHVIQSREGRQGLYFVEFGAAPRASSVVYDRAYSAMAMVRPGEIDWAEVFSGSRLFHVSGITPALSSSAAEVTAEAMRAAKAAGCKISYDLNYRKKLWTPEEARRSQEPLMDFVDLLITTEEDSGIVFGIRESNYEKTAEKAASLFGLEAVAITLREDLSVWNNNWTGIAYSKGKIYKDRTYSIEIVDRIGAGDAFTAGFLFGFLTEGIEKGLRFGIAFSALKHTIPGDFCWASREETEALIEGTKLRISR
jgi:2-dehydro-3-deoxygluconokinase